MSLRLRSSFFVVSLLAVGCSERSPSQPGVRFEHLALELAEPSAEVTVKVRLTDAPAGVVTVPLASSDPSEGLVVPAELVFTAENWSSPQEVTVRAVDDADADGVQAWTLLTGALRSTDDRWNGFDPPDLSLITWDDERGALRVTALAGALEEWGSTAAFTVSLASPPGADVTVALSSLDSTEGTVAPASLTFSPTNWNTPQVVTVTGVDDALDDGDVDFAVRFSPAVSGDANYVGRDPEDVAVSTLDDDVAGLVVSTVAGRPTEAGASATFTVKLRTQPSAPVSFALSSSDPAQGSVSPASLTFTTSNWNTAQAVTASAVDDDVDDGDLPFSVSFAPGTSTDPSYEGLQAADVALSTHDDDTQRLVVAAPTGSPTEAGDAVVFLLQLEAQPTSEVTFPLSSSDETEGTVSPASVTFSPTNWHMPQQVTVTGVGGSHRHGVREQHQRRLPV